MIRRSVISICWLTFSALLQCVNHATTTAGQTVRLRDARVVVLHAYHFGFTWSESISAGIQAVFNDEAGEVDLKFEFPDARFNATEEYLKAVAQKLATKYAGRKIDLIIASDDHALNFMLNHGYKTFPDVPVVFCSVSGYKSQMREKLDLTGLRESIDISATVQTALRLHPQANPIAVILDSSRTGQALKKKTEAVLAPLQWVCHRRPGRSPHRQRLQWLYPKTVQYHRTLTKGSNHLGWHSVPPPHVTIV